MRALVRDPSSVGEGVLQSCLAEDARLSVLAGDATDSRSMHEHLKGATHVYFAAAGCATARLT